MYKLSIIVPIYNVDKYLNKSLECLVNQTLKDIEIILINDGSTDKSLEICQKYASRDPRIRIIDKENEGVSIARNIGIVESKSEFITFMDPDDEIKVDMYEQMLKNIINFDTDISMCNYIKKSEDKEILINLPFVGGKYKREQILYLIKNMIYGNDLNQTPIMGSVWRSIFRKSIIEENNISFPVDIRPMQDLLFIISYLLKCNTIYINENAFYIYDIHQNSAVTGYKENVWYNHKKVCLLLEDILKENALLNDNEKNIHNRWIHSILGCISNEAHLNNKKRLREKLKNINIILNDECLEKQISMIDTQVLNIRKKIIFFCIEKKLVLPIYLYYRILRRFKLIF